LAFQNVILERIVERSCLIICICYYPHKARYKLCHLFLVFWVFWKVPMRTCVHGAQMERFTRICDYISFLATFVGGWLDDTSSFSFKRNLHACKTTWDSSWSFIMHYIQFHIDNFNHMHNITLVKITKSHCGIVTLS
jgi:hypothetical protein